MQVMSKTATSHQSTPLKESGESQPRSNQSQRSAFLVMATNMGWQLAVVVLVPVIGGAQLDKALDTTYLIFIGLGVALLGSGAVMWRTMQLANRLPVPKLTAAQKRTIKKQYEKDDD